MYVKKPVINNVYDSQILLAINTKECIVKEIANITKSQKLTIRRQIQRDLLKNYLNEKTLDKRGKTIYSIRWEGITHDFLEYLKRLIKEKNFSKEEIQKINKEMIYMQDNQYLILILKIMFKEFFKFYTSNHTSITLEDLFKETIASLGSKLNPDNLKPKVFMDLKERKDFREFLNLTHFLKTHFSPRIELDNLFYTELENFTKKNK